MQAKRVDIQVTWLLARYSAHMGRTTSMRNRRRREGSQRRDGSEGIPHGLDFRSCCSFHRSGFDFGVTLSGRIDKKHGLYTKNEKREV